MTLVATVRNFVLAGACLALFAVVPVWGTDFEDGSWKLIEEYRDFRGAAKNFAIGGGMIVLDYVDLTEGKGPVLGGPTAGLGRYLRDIIACDLVDAGIGVVDRDRVAEVMRKTGFLVDDLYRDDVVLRFMDHFPEASGIITGNITLSGNPAQLDVETTLRSRDGDAFVPIVGISSIMTDSNVSAVTGVNQPPLSDNRPNLILAGHPFLDPRAPYRLEIAGRDGTKELRYRNSRVFVAGVAGEEYSITLTNNSGRAAAVALFVDAVPVGNPVPKAGDAIDKSYVLPSRAGKIILDAGQSREIRGWRLGDGATHPFVFAAAADSEDLGRNFWESTGIVSAVFYDVGEGVRLLWDVTRREDGWVLKNIPDPRAATVVSPVFDAAGVPRSVRHSATPAAVLNVHYGPPQRVKNYSPVKEP